MHTKHGVCPNLKEINKYTSSQISQIQLSVLFTISCWQFIWKMNRIFHIECGKKVPLGNRHFFTTWFCFHCGNKVQCLLTLSLICCVWHHFERLKDFVFHVFFTICFMRHKSITLTYIYFMWISEVWSIWYIHVIYYIV